MEKVSTTVVMLFLMLGFPRARCLDKQPEAVEAWFEKLPQAKEKVTKLHLYIHEIVSGKNPSAITVAQANSTAASPTAFGLVRTIDDPLTVGPRPDSQIIGRAQGIYSGASLEEIGLLMTLNLVFTEGKYKGSTLSMLAHNPALDRYREMSIVGGTGVFRLARGIVTAHTVWLNLTSQDSVVEYNIVVLHYVSK